MQGLCSLISILSLAWAGMLCCWHYVGFWPYRCWCDIFFSDGCVVRKRMHFCPPLYHKVELYLYLAYLSQQRTRFSCPFQLMAACSGSEDWNHLKSTTLFVGESGEGRVWKANDGSFLDPAYWYFLGVGRGRKKGETKRNETAKRQEFTKRSHLEHGSGLHSTTLSTTS